MHLFLAALLWTVVGAALSFFGVRWSLEGGLPLPALLVAGAVILGVMKALYLLDRVSAKTIARIRERGDGACLGGFLSVKSWTLVAAMAGTGALLRHGLLPHVVVGIIYVAVGTGLLVASRRLWAAWWSHGRGDDVSAQAGE